MINFKGSQFEQAIILWEKTPRLWPTWPKGSYAKRSPNSSRPWQARCNPIIG